MNIKDFSLNNSFNNIDKNKITPNNKQFQNKRNSLIKKSPSDDLIKTKQPVKKGSVTRERVFIKENNFVRADDGTLFDTSAPKGTYVNLII